MRGWKRRHLAGMLAPARAACMERASGSTTPVRRALALRRPRAEARRTQAEACSTPQRSRVRAPVARRGGAPASCRHIPVIRTRHARLGAPASCRHARPCPRGHAWSGLAVPRFRCGARLPCARPRLLLGEQSRRGKAAKFPAAAGAPALAAARPPAKWRGPQSRGPQRAAARVGVGSRAGARAKQCGARGLKPAAHRLKPVPRISAAASAPPPRVAGARRPRKRTADRRRAVREAPRGIPPAASKFDGGRPRRGRRRNWATRARFPPAPPASLPTAPG